MAMTVLTDDELAAATEALDDGWQVRDGALRKGYTLADFAAAVALANRVAAAAEAADHHPDMLIGWGRLELAWVSHSAGGITDSDVAMARRSDELAAAS
jgi:4a-hydroxytetrahydrobiopterin dehydratase